MKIACIIHSLDGGGAERVMAGLANRLSHRGHDVNLITLDDGQRNRHRLDPAVHRHALAVMTGGGSWLHRIKGYRRRLAAVRDVIERLRPDVVLSFCDRTNVLTLLATRGMNVPVIASERSDPRHQTLGVFGARARRSSYRRAARLVALSDSVADDLQRFHQHPVIVIPSAVSQPTIFSDRLVATENRLILGIGRLEIEKGFDRLIRAFAKFQQTELGHGWKLRILGEGSQRQSLKQTINETASIDVAMPGWIQPVWEELAAATMFVLPSRYEGFPSAMLEAMAAGVPCVAVDCPSGLRAIIDHQRNGWLVDSDINGLHEGMMQMAACADQRERMGQAGREVVQRFSWESMVEAYEALMRDVSRGRSG